MKHRISLLLLLAVGLTATAQTKKTLFVIVDGIPADVIEKLNTPAIDEISRAGGFTRAYVGGEKNGYSQTPTISAVGYNTVLTGTWVNKHNVWDNDIADPNYHYQTIFRFLKDHDSTRKIAIFSSWLDNRTRLAGENLPQTRHLRFDYHVDGLELDTVNRPHDDARAFMHQIDETVTDSAAACIRRSAPDLSWVYLEYTDDMGHMHGDSPQFYRAVELMDRQMGRLWQAIQYRKKHFKEDWLMIITTDHGRDSATGKNHGGQSDRERLGWIATNARHLNAHFRKGNPSIADIMPTIVSFMGISIPKKDLMEIDGVSLTGKVGAAEPSATFNNNKLQVRWKNIDGRGDVKIWLATTNGYKTGVPDEYTLVVTAPAQKQFAEIDVRSRPSGFYKVVLETSHNYLNRWIVIADEKNEAK